LTTLCNTIESIHPVVAHTLTSGSVSVIGLECTAAANSVLKESHLSIKRLTLTLLTPAIVSRENVSLFTPAKVSEAVSGVETIMALLLTALTPEVILKESKE
jgi:hypothetical protein